MTGVVRSADLVLVRDHHTRVKGRFDFLPSRVVCVAAYSSNHSELTLGVTPILFNNFTRTIVDTEGLSVQIARVRWLIFEKKKKRVEQGRSNTTSRKKKSNPIAAFVVGAIKSAETSKYI